MSVSSPIVHALVTKSLPNCVSIEPGSWTIGDPDAIDSGSKSDGGSEPLKDEIRRVLRLRFLGCGVGDGEGEGDEASGEAPTAGESMT